MIAWSIQAALESRCFERVIVSTDDKEIAEVAIAFGAEAPFRRPPELSDDMTPTTPVVAHAIEWQKQIGPVEKVCCVYATAPFVRPEDLRAALELMTDQTDYVFPATTFDFPVQRAIRVGKDGRVSMLQPEHLMTRSQDLEEAYHDAGQFYWGQASAWLTDKPIFGGSSRVLKLPRYRVQDIDTVEDWERAELIFSAVIARSQY